MKIYCVNSSRNTIDFIVERVLQAYIAESGEYAVVTVDDDGRSIDEIGKSIIIDNMEENHFSFFFSPTKLVCGMGYILATAEERENYNVLINVFKQSFYDSVIKYYEDGNKITRAEAVRLIWNDFSGKASVSYANVDEEEVVLLQKSVDDNDVENRITEKFVELIIKYAIHITMWEQRYSGHEANKMIEKRTEKQQERGVEPFTPNKKTLNTRFSFLFTGEPEMKRVKDPKYIIQEFSVGGMIESSKLVQNNIYKELRIQKDKKIDKHSRFFVTAKKERQERNTVYTSLLGQLLFVNYMDYWFLNDRKKMEFFLEDDFVGDISAEIEQVLDAAIEIVLMLNMFINEVDLEQIATHPFAKKTMELHVNVLPVVKYLMSLEDRGGDIKARLSEIDAEPKEREKIENRAKERIVKLKDENFGATIMGGYYMFASSDPKVVEGTKYADARARAKRKEKDYWEKRYQCLKRWSFPEKYQMNFELVVFLMKYLQNQNQAIHNRIREILDVYVMKEK